MAKTLFFLSSFRSGTGNATTINRIIGHFPSCSIERIDVDVESVDWNQFQSIQKANPKDLGFIGVHAYRAGRWLLTLPPILQSEFFSVLIFGGTDLNQYALNQEELILMTNVVHLVTKIVAFTKEMKEIALKYWPEIEHKIVIITQAIETCPSNYSIRKQLALKDTDIILLLPCGLRKVKDPLYLLPIFSSWRKENSNVHFVIIGPALDREFSEVVKTVIQNTEGAYYLGELEKSDLHAVMKDADIVLNTSISEGLSNALLEALELGTVILARNIKGNSSLIQHGINGFLFSSPSEFLELAKSIVESNTLKVEDIVANGKEWIEKYHNLEVEKNNYNSLLQND